MVSDVCGFYDLGCVVVFIGIENGYLMGKDMCRFQEFYDLGVCYMFFIYNGYNDLVDFVIVCFDLKDFEVEYGGFSVLG